MERAEITHQLGIQLQDGNLPDRLQVAEALTLYSSFYRDPADWRVLIDSLGLASKATTNFGELSGGQKQRLSVALALVGNPQVAVLDELTTGLDPHARRETWETIETVRASGVTILLVTHFMEEAERLCDRVALLNKGRPCSDGRHTVRTDPAGPGRPPDHVPSLLTTRRQSADPAARRDRRDA